MRTPKPNPPAPPFPWDPPSNRDTDQSRLRLFVLGLLLVSTFLHTVTATIRITIDGTDIRSAVVGADELGHLLLIAGSATIVAWLAWYRFSRRALRRIDLAATMLVPLTSVLDMLLHPPTPIPEMPALMLLTLVLTGRAAVVPSSAVRTAVIGLLSLCPLALTAVLGDSLRTPDGGPGRILAFTGVFGFGVAVVAVTVVTSHVVHRLRRTVHWATRLGPYVVGNPLGEGGMGTVYEAWHGLLRRRTALKLIRPSMAGAEAEERFAAEARITSQLNHPNTVSLYDYGRTPDGIDYYAMELVDSIDLHELVRREGALPPGRVANIVRQVAASLAHAHARGLIHRDIKPSNVMVCNREGQPDLVKVLDFGLAMRWTADMDPREARAGTPAFMAPELAADPTLVGPATDVYAVAVLGYFLLTGSIPFAGRGEESMLRAHARDPLVPPSLRCSREVPRDLEMVLLSCLRKNPERRPPDGAALLDALRSCAADPEWTEAHARAWWESFDPDRPDTRPRTEAVATLSESPAIPLAVRRVSFG